MQLPTHRLCLWSGPRNVSTALMYSFAQRPDTRVMDEPLYAYYLAQNPDALHPGREEVLSGMENDGEKVVERTILGASDRPVLFIKNMAHHLPGLKTGFLKSLHNIFLIRDPEEMLPSLVNQIPNPVLRDTALGLQWELFQQLKEEGTAPIVLDSRLLLSNPEKVLRQLFESLSLPFYPEMLHWKAGSRPEDGVWAKHWYHRVHESTGFAAYQRTQAKVPESLESLLEICKGYYEKLLPYAIQAA